MRCNQKKLYFVLIIVFFLTTENGYTSGTAGISGADFLEIGIGSRPLGMGEAFTAANDDINSIYYNPAGLGSMKYPILSLFHQELIIDSRFEHFSLAYPLGGGFLGASNSLFWVPPFEKIDINGQSDGKVLFYNGVFTTAYGYDLDFMYVGGGIKYIYQRIDTLMLHDFAADFGILKGFHMYTPFDAPLKNFHVAISVLNLGTKVLNDPLPRMIRLGTAYKLTEWFGVNLDLSEYIIDSSDIYDFTHGFNESFRVNTGVEFSYLDLISLRGGYRFNDAGTYSVGMGFNYIFGDLSFIIDTSYSDAGVFGSVYSLNVSIKLIPRVITMEHKELADEHYRRGIKYYIANDIQSALNEFKTCRDYNPYHKNVNKKIEDLEELIRLDRENVELDEELKRIK